MKDLGKLLTALISVLFGVFALVVFVQVIELIIGLLSITFGIVAMIWVYRARSSLSKGTTLYDYTYYFFLSLLFIFLFSLWDTMGILFEWSGKLIYPKYFLITAAYMVFAFSSYKILYMGKQFGFNVQVKNMDYNKKKNEKVKKK